MDNSGIPLFRLEMKGCSGTVFTPIKWPDDEVAQNDDADPNRDELDDFIRAFEESLEPGGDNHQWGLDAISDARIIRQSDGEIVVYWSGAGDS